ncbi:bifunctional 2-polyprenyl-6-hydroxyphenol methylase/3-demethylubiquinol 3-O-methyltransferase UbiG [Pseudomonas sp. B21-035]|uniref:class I SAM-dependent methyltransferase n=1 Tax=Pseudomonas sp. B21-035 TaxID=2895484 RepID=UPI00215FB234|nr:nodulation S family protein [Pseudomonas sp. B21-035]UVL58540.1 nodulation S family protein [Pseudomonas sp. B21-035]
MSVSASYFEHLFAHSDDPWAFRTRWYEKRKRELLLASLPRQYYGRVFEPACANGELSAALAERCESLLCQDLNATAVQLAAERLRPWPNAEVTQGCLPGDWPAGEFELIVLSEIGYYLDPGQWLEVLERATASLTSDGALLLCHWLHPIDGCPQTGHQVHELLAERLPLYRSLRHEEADFVLEYWCVQPYAIDLDEPCL